MTCTHRSGRIKYTLKLNSWKTLNIYSATTGRVWKIFFFFFPMMKIFSLRFKPRSRCDFETLSVGNFPRPWHMAVNPRRPTSRDDRHRLIWFPSSPSSISLSLGIRMVMGNRVITLLRRKALSTSACFRSQSGDVKLFGRSGYTLLFCIHFIFSFIFLSFILSIFELFFCKKNTS